MKFLFYFLFLSFFIVSCKKTEEESPITPTSPPSTGEVEDSLKKESDQKDNKGPDEKTFDEIEEEEGEENEENLTPTEVASEEKEVMKKTGQGGLEIIDPVDLPFEQIVGVFNENIDVHWDLWDFWKTSVSSQIVLGYSPLSGTLMVKIRSTDPAVSGSFCSLMSNFINVQEKRKEINQISTTYQAESFMALDNQRNPIGDASNVIEKITVLVELEEAKSVTLYFTDKDKKQTREVELDLAHRENNTFPDAESFFYNWKNTSPCI